jgi:hypothetical protein
MDRHSEQCARCANARDRITRASSSFPSLRAQSAPDLAWDAVRARIHWSLATERRARTQQAPWRPIARLMFGAAFATGVAVVIATGGLRRASSHEPVLAQPSAPSAPSAPVTPRALHGLVSRLAGDVLVDGLRAGAFDRRIDTGTVLATGDGRIDIQFGDHSAFALGAHSKLELRRMDAAMIELVVDGTVDVEVAPRAAGQRFLVIAGGETIEVRGTQFRVAHDPSGAVRVACRHGLVVVRDGSGEQQVAASRALDVRPGGAVADVHVMQASADELAQIAAATPVTTPLWADYESAARNSTVLEIATPGKRDVRLDGVELGQAPLRVRVAPGRHTVEAADSAGRYHHAGWVDTAIDHPARAVVRTEPEAAAAPSSGERRRQLHAGLAAHRAQLARCTRAMTKAGVTDLSVEIGIAVTAAGDVDHLNVDADLPATTRSCIEDVLHDVRFGPGAAAEWRERLPL